MCVKKERAEKEVRLRGESNITTAALSFHTSVLKCGFVTGRQARVEDGKRPRVSWF